MQVFAPWTRAALAATLLIAAAGHPPRLAAQDATTPFSALHSFLGSPDGQNPYAGLTLGANGALYGTTNYGGTSNDGTVFEMTPPAAPGGTWTETILYSFTGAPDGQNPGGSLVMDKAGVLYGTTGAGGASGNNGTVFSLKPPEVAGGAWTETVLYSFQGAPDGQNPTAGLVLDPDGVLYGTTYVGGTANFGTVFSLTRPAQAGGDWTEAVLYSFLAAGDGRNPVAALTMDSAGALYGTTYRGGAHQLGSAFKLDPPAASGDPWTETLLHSFSGSPDGRYPRGELLIGKRGVLYGTTAVGGSLGYGSVFELKPPSTAKGSWKETVLYSFASSPSDGAVPYAGVIAGARGVLYGTTNAGGSKKVGTVFKLVPPAKASGKWTETVIHDFTGKGTDGAEPEGPLVKGAKGEFYGTTAFGGTYQGTVFEIK